MREHTHIQDQAENWKAIPGWEGMYSVSDRGRIRSERRTVKYRSGQTRVYPSRALTPNSGKGYPYCNLSRNGELSRAYIHRTVLDAFVGPGDGQCACHIDGNPLNNRLDNLRWGSQSDNMDDAVRHGTHYWAAKDCCPQGHPYSGPNLVVGKKVNGKDERRCLACVRARGYIANHPELKPDLPAISDSYYADIQRTGGEHTRARCRRGHLLEGTNLMACDLRKGKRKCKSCHSANAYSYRHRDEDVNISVVADEYYAKYGPVTVIHEGVTA